MAWQLTGQIHEACSCKLLCPCWLGPEIEPDQGWCGGMILFDIQQGHSDGVDLSGCKAVFFGEWPGNFWAGQGTARLIIDEATTADQRRELEAILSGQKGGPMAAVASAVITTLLPTQYAPIQVAWGDETTATIGQAGALRSRLLKDSAGRPATVQGAAAMAAFQLERMEVAYAAGTRVSAPQMQPWEGSSSTRSRIAWSG